ncbi:rab-like protein 6 [Rhizophagus clarus]|uniref:Rab-like protein 6 n=1 Tax=Rhizophagus clarus TaxID=94130 RepID=A0A8H3QQ68_9GLOM|nr:rab-like protein 6 [Rhizophagus clarus]
MTPRDRDRHVAQNLLFADNFNLVTLTTRGYGNEQTKEVLQDISLPSNTSFKPMQGKFQKGVQYNMKIIIRGDIRTGKSTLFNRLQGYPFKEEYITTPQIEVANIQWKYNQTSDIIKVEIWDVVDKGINPTPINRRPNLSDGTGLKIENNQGPVTPTSPARLAPELSPDQLALDAATINVYRNTHGVILMFDITKNWTFDYAVKELKAIPEHMPILLLGNFGDLSSQRAITKSQIYQSIAECNRLRVTEYPPANMVRYVETSMLTGFGLEYIYKYLGIPFLQLQKDILRQQLELKTKELATLLDTLDDSEQISVSSRKRHSISKDIPDTKQVEQDRLELEKSALKDLWDKEFRSLSQQESGESVDEEVKSMSHTSPTLNLDQHTSVLISKRPKAATPDIAIIDEFDAGELEDDFFDDAPDPSLVLPLALPPKVEEQDDQDSSNPMVTADEDLAGNVVNDIEDDPDRDNVRQSIKFNSDLSDVWKLRQNNTTSARFNDDSSDDDLITGAKQMNLLDRRPSNAASFIEKSRLSQVLREENSFEPSKYSENILSMINNPYSDNVIVSNSSQEHDNFIDPSFHVGDYTPMTFGTPSAYEEIGEGQDNPWLEKDSNQHQQQSTGNSSSNYQKLHLHHPKSFNEGLISSPPWGGLNNNDDSRSNLRNSQQNTEESLLDAYIKSKEQLTNETAIPKKKKKKKTSSSNSKEDDNDEKKREKSKKKKPKSSEVEISDDKVATKEKKKSSKKRTK